MCGSFAEVYKRDQSRSTDLRIFNVCVLKSRKTDELNKRESRGLEEVRFGKQSHLRPLCPQQPECKYFEDRNYDLIM